jgi:hypothetical protein
MRGGLIMPNIGGEAAAADRLVRGSRRDAVKKRERGASEERAGVVAAKSFAFFAFFA